MTMGSFGDIIGELSVKPVIFLYPNCAESFPMYRTAKKELETVKIWLKGDWLPDDDPENNYSEDEENEIKAEESSSSDSKSNSSDSSEVFSVMSDDFFTAGKDEMMH